MRVTITRISITSSFRFSLHASSAIWCISVSGFLNRPFIRSINDLIQGWAWINLTGGWINVEISIVFTCSTTINANRYNASSLICSTYPYISEWSDKFPCTKAFPECRNALLTNAPRVQQRKQVCCKWKIPEEQSKLSTDERQTTCVGNSHQVQTQTPAHTKLNRKAADDRLVYTIGAKSVLMTPNWNADCACVFWSCKIACLWRCPCFTRLSSDVNFGNNRLANATFTTEMVIELLHIRRATVFWAGTFIARTATTHQIRVAGAERVSSYRTENRVLMQMPITAGAVGNTQSDGTMVHGLQLVHFGSKYWLSMW